MSPWWDGRLIGFDLETTATDPEEARIVTAAVIACGGGEPTECRTWLADPGVEIPEQASAVHGITTERARAEGQPAREVIGQVLRHLSGFPPWPLVVFNARFDLTILDREARRHGFPAPNLTFAIIDPLVIDKHLDQFRRGSRRLDAVCEHYGIALGDDAHDAASDALAAARLAYVIGKRGEIKRRVRNAEEGREKARLVREWESCRNDLSKLHAAQVRWAAEQAIGLEEHFARAGNPQAVERAWPLIPYRQEAVT